VARIKSTLPIGFDSCDVANSSSRGALGVPDRERATLFFVRMTLTAFEASLTKPAPPPNLHPLVEALWHERRGDWTRAHEIAQGIDGDDAAWVHAYLHRREGDLPNARYWYRHAGKLPETGILDDEWRVIVEALLER
jgi:hypothetical protein